MARHYLTVTSLSVEETRALFDEARRLKAERAARRSRADLAGRHVILFFEKPSVRTRLSFSIAAAELGASVVELGASNTKVGKGEHVEDFAKVVSRYGDALVARVFAQDKLEGMARTSDIPVINALSDSEHPCQALADVLTILERWPSLEGLTLAFVGEGNNVAVSLARLSVRLGAKFRLAAPPGYGFPPALVAELGASFSATERPEEAAAGAHVLYTDTWVSMGDEAEAAERARAFAGFAIDERLLGLAAPGAIAMHCLPAVRGQEIDVGVMYGPRSAIWDQAENRLHVQKALLRRLVLGA